MQSSHSHLDATSKRQLEKVYNGFLRGMSSLANEPSRGLYFVHLHSRHSQKNITANKNSLKEQSTQIEEEKETLDEMIGQTRLLNTQFFSFCRDLRGDLEKVTALSENIVTARAAAKQELKQQKKSGASNSLSTTTQQQQGGKSEEERKMDSNS